jgi:hypothetical protein
MDSNEEFYDSNYLYGFLTNLVDDDNKADNFFNGLKYKNNFKVICTFLNAIMSCIDYELDIHECFDCNSESKYVSSFRSIVFSPAMKKVTTKDIEELYEIIMKKNKKILIPFIEEIHMDKKNKSIKVIVKDYETYSSEVRD